MDEIMRDEWEELTQTERVADRLRLEEREVAETKADVVVETVRAWPKP